MDFAVLTLDINSGRMYSGAGAGSMKFCCRGPGRVGYSVGDTVAALNAGAIKSERDRVLEESRQPSTRSP
jgi:PPE-repeat protein